MRKPVLTIFYQFNPWSPTIGGIQTIILTFIKYAPPEFELRLVGTEEDPHLPTGKWREGEIAGKVLHFMPLIKVQKDNFSNRIPTTLKYTAALFGRCFASDFMHFYRIEPTIATLRWQGEKTLFVQNDVQKQVEPSSGKNNAILWQRFPAAYFALERILVGQFSHILSCNTASVEYYQQHYPAIADRVSFLKNTVDNEIFYPLTLDEREERRRNLARQLGLPEDKRFILFAGRLHPQKDPVLLVRSIAVLNEPNAHLIIAGEGSLENEVRAEIVRLDLSKQVTMLGPVAQKELAHLQRVCSVFVLTSAFEGLPFVVLEALACGTPIVTTRSGETPNLLSANSGIVCEERTPDAIADALRKVLLHPDNYPIEACVRAAEPYSASAVVGAVYRDMWHYWEQQNLSSRVQNCFTSFT
ncbi:glycosyltransferase [Gloeocapsopsis sp. IPPAS B-1203]|uniref:glycosyltransferase n=1 Tax=Gloeocapsopsis sp. IPPAS B-1203 TaxID=2049454 RepID=UPI000C19AC66|nr:glycosyltransferase [Gloeocapsopsis sp. IPPAS B-1203]PIG94128.1 glycoside hydrolase [Gloeocapsopsis sp. IPPAS B-1203]